MCNLYNVGPSPNENRAAWEVQVKAAITQLPNSEGIRKTDPGIVVHLSGDKLIPRVMRWGFVRHFNPSINNARSDKLATGMWQDAWKEKRRCLIPVRRFFEWSGPKGKKQTHRIYVRGREDEWMWMAGLWEEHPVEGLRYSMITTGANPAMSQIHDRMPAILHQPDFAKFLTDADPLALIVPFRDELSITDCENPLVKQKPKSSGPEQMDLF
jgi:putative SOS response-associated peptidase YedK